QYASVRMETNELDYDLPPELIAQHPAVRRDATRLLVYDRRREEVRNRVFSELGAEISNELVVVNDTRVLPARLPIERPRGEVLLLEALGDGVWEALARPTRRLRPGSRYGDAELHERLGGGRWRVRLHGEPAGETPLPPYIVEPLSDPSRYQTVYAEEAGSAAAPTAGLHFTPELLARLEVERVTLHVGLDTFRPVATETLEEHPLHGERYACPESTWQRISEAERVLAVGTTTTRVLETLAFSVTATDGAARAGVLRTAHGDVFTPVFMPVGTKATVKSLAPGEVRSVGAQIVLGNSYHLHFRPGDELIAEQGGLHRFMAWEGPILTDSGGFQVFSLRDTLLAVDDDGVTFRNVYDGAATRFTPELAAAIQANLGSDIAMCLDEVPPPTAERRELADAVRRTTEWARRQRHAPHADGQLRF